MSTSQAEDVPTRQPFPCSEGQPSEVHDSTTPSTHASPPSSATGPPHARNLSMDDSPQAEESQCKPADGPCVTGTQGCLASIEDVDRVDRVEPQQEPAPDSNGSSTEEPPVPLSETQSEPPAPVDACPTTPPRRPVNSVLGSPYLVEEIKGGRRRNSSTGTFGQHSRSASFQGSEDFESPSLNSSPAAWRRRTMAFFTPRRSAVDGAFVVDIPPRTTSHQSNGSVNGEAQLRSAQGWPSRSAPFDAPLSGGSPLGNVSDEYEGSSRGGSPVYSLPMSQALSHPSIVSEAERFHHERFDGMNLAHANLSCLSFPDLDPMPPTHSMRPRHVHSPSMDSDDPRSSIDSMRTATALLPTPGISRSNTPAPLAIHTRRDSQVIPTTVVPTSVMADHMSPSKTKSKAQLIRTARKAEQTLGEALSEQAVERYIVDPSLSEKTVLTHFETGWPDSPDPATFAGPEWERQDCVPQRKREATEVSQAPTVVPSRGPLGWIKDLAKSRKVPEELEVRIQREIRVAETWQPTAAPMSSTVSLTHQAPKVKGRAMPSELQVHIEREVCIAEDWNPTNETYGAGGLNRGPPPSPAVSSVSGVSVSSSAPSPLLEDQEEIARRARRLQLAKLQRLLGVQVPLEMVPEVTEVNGTRVVRSASMDTRKQWSRRLSTLTISSPVDISQAADIAARQVGGLTAEERSLARRRASKLEQVFGEAPPQDMFLPSVSPPQGHSRSGSTEGSETYIAYRDSIYRLIDLVEHDQDRLASIVDELDTILPCEVSTTVSSSPSPTAWRFGLRSVSSSSLSSIPSGHVQQAAWRRNRKLTRFFGERSIDFSNPPPVMPTGSNNARRLATLDGVLKEMWQNVQTEVGKGDLRTAEANKLIDMMGSLKRKGDMSSWAEV